MSKPHLLLITEKWCDAKPELHESNTLHNLHGSLGVSDLATFDSLFYDEEQIVRNRHIDVAVNEYLGTKGTPDVTVILPMHGSPLNPTNDIVKQLKDSGSKVVMTWPDTVGGWTTQGLGPLNELVDYHVLWDSYEGALAASANCGFLWTPQDPRIYNNPNIIRDIDVSFVGSKTSSVARYCLLRKLENRGLKIYQCGGQREQYVPPKEYAEIFQRSKISLNLSYAGHSAHQLKGRVFEITMCGALLLDTVNSLTPLRFAPMREYIPVGDASHSLGHISADIVDRIQWLLGHRKQRELIARRGHAAANKHWGCVQYWKAVLSAVGIDV